jgi:4-amino-4-deoxy-L-arabinose transferase-like glycosyltransferase
MWISAELFDRPTSLISGALAAIYPGAITTSVLLLSEAPFMPLMLLILGALWLANNRPEQAIRWNILAGVMSAVAILIRPSWLLFMPFYYLIRFIFFPQRMRTTGLAMVAGTSIAVVMLPWWIRNYQVTGHFVLTTLQVGPSLYDGLGPQATGGSDSGMEFSAEFANQLRNDVKGLALPPGEFEYELNRRLANSALETASADPRRTAKLALLKVYRSWWPLPSVVDMPGGLATRFAFAIGMLGILIPAIVQLSRRKRLDLFPYIIPVIYFTFLHAVFVGSIRYRQPAVLALIIVAAPELREWGRRLLSRQSFVS